MNVGYPCAQYSGTHFVKAGERISTVGAGYFVPHPSGPLDSRQSAWKQHDLGASVVGRRASKHGEPYGPGNSDFDGEQAEPETTDA